MNNRLLIAGALLLAFSACHQPAPHDHRLTSADSFSIYVPADSANKMILSYLNSIHYPDNDTDIQSLIVSAAQLRRYLDSIPGSAAIVGIKLMFAHTLAFANSSRAGTPAGYKSGAFTVVISAVDAAGNYVLYPDNMALDYTQPCPPICPPGTAANPLLPTVSASPLSPPEPLYHAKHP